MKYSEIIHQLYALPEDQLHIDTLKRLKREFAKKHNIKDLPANTSLLRSYHKMCKDGVIEKNSKIEKILRKRGIRSQSGIVPVQVLTKPFWCPGKCIFCPNDQSMPKSYIKSEPGAMRALLNQFDPYKQTYNRLLSLTLTGHPTDKIEMIVLGGTRDVYPKEYKIQFIKGLYDACNTFDDFFGKVRFKENNTSKNKFAFDIDNLDDIKYPDTLEESIRLNENANNRIIGLTIETRPEYVTDENCLFWRELGVTRLEMGVQSLYNSVLDANKRGHTVEDIYKAIHKLRQYGFKISVHIMPGLYKSSTYKDIKTFKKLFSNPYMKPDEIKFYPTSVIPNTELHNLYKQKKYTPLSTKQIQKIIKKVWLDIIPPYTRIKRLIRDIPSTEIVAGSQITNLSQLTYNQTIEWLQKHKSKAHKLYKRLYKSYTLFNDLTEFLSKEAKTTRLRKKKIYTYVIGNKPDLNIFRNFVSLDTRSREIRNQKNPTEQYNLIIRKYLSSVGKEYFISFEDPQGFLFGFTRLLIPDFKQTLDIQGLGPKTAIIRELHVYGNVQKLKEKASNGTVQHKGFGRQLIDIAEKITQIHKYSKLSVISGIGVRKYYYKLGYKLEGTYVTKDIDLYG